MTNSTATAAPALLTVEEVMALTGLARASVYKAFKAKELPALHVGKRWLISRTKIAEALGASEEQIEVARAAAAGKTKGAE